MPGKPDAPDAPDACAMPRLRNLSTSRHRVLVEDSLTPQVFYGLCSLYMLMLLIVVCGWVDFELFWA